VGGVGGGGGGGWGGGGGGSERGGGGDREFAIQEKEQGGEDAAHDIDADEEEEYQMALALSMAPSTGDREHESAPALAASNTAFFCETDECENMYESRLMNPSCLSRDSVERTHEMPYLERCFSAKEPYN